VGYTEGRGPEAVRHAGYLDGFELSRAEAEALIMAARLKAGWIEALPEPEGEAAEGEAAEGEASESEVTETAAAEPQQA
jgi:N utilization substance protein A